MVMSVPTHRAKSSHRKSSLGQRENAAAKVPLATLARKHLLNAIRAPQLGG